jgi:hypothetical protein
MQVGVCRVKLHLPENESLKGKRQVIRSVTTRVRSRFNVAIAEIEDNQLWQIASLGITCVSNDARHANEMLSKVVEFIQDIRGDAELVDYEVEILSSLD